MRYGVVIPGGDVDTLIEVAQEIEAARWDAVFVGDGVYGTDPWIALAAIAVRTTRVRLGPLVTPASRRRPWKLASETATLDRLSHGRVILPVGLGAINTGFAQVGEQTDRQLRARLLDECLEVVMGFWSGRPFAYDGRHYHVHWDMDWSYTPVQQPRIPIWVVGAWPWERSLARALRYDGVLAVKTEAGGPSSDMTADEIRALKRLVAERRGSEMPFDIVLEGVTPLGDRAQADAAVMPLAEAGATWWIESMWDAPGGMNAVRVRIRQGPPEV
jgi:alkanesulfonate monooxygenase SsuD/methylene tetrahydromethanopterin reductase-like flavin-dependent oxidoreductase (luciferase family)